MQSGSLEDFIDKSIENLKAAELLLEDRLYNASVNRAYYAAFHAAIAALSKYGVEFDQINHKAVQSNFPFELIRRRKIFPSRFKSYLMKLQEKRILAFYSRIAISQKVASEQLFKAKEFVACIAKEFNNVPL